MKIKSVYIDGLHNAVNKTYEFGDMVYIFGHNGAGKSTILQAIQFALLGYFPGTAKTKEAMLRHSPKKAIQVKLTLDGVVIERKLLPDTSILKIDPENYDISSIISGLELPIFNFNEFVGQTANKLKEYFIKHILPTADGNLDWNTILSDSISDCNFEDREAILTYGMGIVSGLDGSVLDQVVAANAKFKEEQSFNKSELQRLQNTIDSLIYYDDYVGPTNLEELNSQLLSLGAIRDQMLKYESAQQALQASRDEYARITSHIEMLGGQPKYDKLHSDLEELNVAILKNDTELSTIRQELARLQTEETSTDSIISSKGVCPYTQESCKSILAKIDDIRNQAVANKARKIELENQKSLALGTQTELTAKKSEILGLLQHFQELWHKLDTLETTLGSLPDKPNTDKTLQEVNLEIDALTKRKSKLEANIRYNETIENITKLKFETEFQGDALKHWVKTTDTNGLQTTLMVTPFEDLATLMTRYIQQMYGRDDIAARFIVSNKANSFSFGLVRAGDYIPYDLLSSGEKCLYTLALMICIVNNNDSPLKVLLCDDMFDHLDASAIENTFAALKQIHNVQFIFAGVKDCENARDVMLTIE